MTPARRKRARREDAQDAVASLLQRAADLEECDVAVCLAAVETDEDIPKVRTLQISDELTDEFRSVAVRVIKRMREDAESGDLVAQPYDAGTKLDPHEVEVVDLEAEAEIRGQIEVFDNLADLGVFDSDEENFVRRLRFYAMIVHCDDRGPIYLFRTYTPKKELSRSPYFGAILAGNQFDRVTEPLLLFDDRIDCVAYAQHLFVINKANFQMIFRYFERVQRLARATLRRIRDRVPIANFDEFEAVCSRHLQKLEKLKNIASKPYFNRLTMREIRTVIRKMDLPIETRTVDGEEALVFDAEDPWAILRLLDDDYLNSLMTGENYTVNSKRALSE